MFHRGYTSADDSTEDLEEVLWKCHSLQTRFGSASAELKHPEDANLVAFQKMPLSPERFSTSAKMYQSVGSFLAAFRGVDFTLNSDRLSLYRCVHVVVV